MNLLRLLSVFFKWLSEARPDAASPAVLVPLLETLLRAVLALLHPNRLSLPLDWPRVNPLVFLSGTPAHYL